MFLMPPKLKTQTRKIQAKFILFSGRRVMVKNLYQTSKLFCQLPEHFSFNRYINKINLTDKGIIFLSSQILLYDVYQSLIFNDTIKAP